MPQDFGDRASQDEAGPPYRDTPAGPPGIKFGPYTIEREAGRGRFAVVYRAIDTRDRTEVALKLLTSDLARTAPEQALEEVRSEAERLRPLSHPNIVGLREFGVAQGRAYLVFPFVAGQPLDQAIFSGALSRPKAVEALAKAAEAVHYAHRRGLIHRDLKPAHIVVSPDGEPHVLDFGLSWRRGQGGDFAMQSIVGTPAYMSPEQARGEEKGLKPATDIYSLGAILYEVLSGRPPFEGRSSGRVWQMVLSAPPEPPEPRASDLPADLVRVAMCCLEKDPAKRYPLADQLADDLRRALRGEPLHGPSRSGFLRRLFG
jgi:serine/threonine protein kinase